jgi:hypothetical protein
MKKNGEGFFVGVNVKINDGWCAREEGESFMRINRSFLFPLRALLVFVYIQRAKVLKGKEQRGKSESSTLIDTCEPES